MQPEIVSEQMINGLICNNFTFYRTLIGVHIWWAKLFKAVLILLIAIRLFELLAPAGFGIMCLLLLLKKKILILSSLTVFCCYLLFDHNFSSGFSFVLSSFYFLYLFPLPHSHFPWPYASQSFVLVSFMISPVMLNHSVHNQVNLGHGIGPKNSLFPRVRRGWKMGGGLALGSTNPGFESCLDLFLTSCKTLSMLLDCSQTQLFVR